MKRKTASNSKVCAILGLVIFSLSSPFAVNGKTAFNEPPDEPLVAPPHEGLLVVHPDNRRYLMVKGDTARNAVLLSGSHTWAEFQTYQDEEFDYIDWLDKLLAWNHNFMRGWIWEDDYYSPIPYAKSGNKYDLTKYNSVYFDQLKRRIREAHKRGIYISVMLFQGWSVLGPDRGRRPVPWPRHPYHVRNNINGIDGDPDGNGNGYDVHTLKVPNATKLQEAYVKHFIDELNEFDNIIWEIGNECNPKSAAWQYHMIDFIKSCEVTRPKQHLVWINLGEKEVFDPKCHADIVSPNGDQRYLRNPPRATGNKVVIADSDHLAPLRVAHVQFWKWFTRGMHPILMDCKYQGLSWWTGRSFRPEHVKWQQMRDAIGVIRRYADRMNLAKMAPQDEKTDSPSSTRYCLYQPGGEYLIYQPTPNKEFDVRLPVGKYRYEWIIPTTGKARTGMIRSAGGRERFKPPFPWPATLYLKRISPDAPDK
ncbi:MAG: glycoside hydrolase 5 family protein [Planctomycetota bacterium]